MRALVLAAIASCAAPGAPKDRLVSVVVTSGRPQPAPEDVSVSTGEAVLVRAEGLGPPRVIVLGPRGERVPTTDTDGGQRFVPEAPGSYRIELEDGGGLVLARVLAR